MLVKLGPIIGDASGRLGTVIAARNRGGAYLRNGTKPLTSTTQYALAAKALLGTLSQNWQELTATQRASWTAWAQSHPVLNRLGESRVLTGSQSYVKINAVIDNAGGTIIDVPPVGTAPDSLITLTVEYDIGTGNKEIAYTATPLAATDVLYVRACVANSAGIVYVTNMLRLIGVSAAAQASPFDIETLFDARFGEPNVGDSVHVAVAVCNADTGLVSPQLRASTVVISTP